MAQRVVLHIGTMKSGTSYLQSVLMLNNAVLRESGFSYLGDGRFARQSKAVRGVLHPSPKRRRRRRWADIAEEARRLDGEAGLVSMEFLSFAAPEQVDRVLEPLQGLVVDVVLTVRDQFRAIPAQWQTSTRNLGTQDWSGYLRAIEDPKRRRPRAARSHDTFHRAQDVVTMIDRWGRHPGVDALHVVTVPPSGAAPTELWHRFRTAAGIPDVALGFEGVRDNPSLGYASCDYLRRVNTTLSDVAPSRYRTGMRPLARDVLSPLRASEDSPQLDRAAAAYARRRNEEIRERVGAGAAEGDLRLVGSVEDLPVPTGTADFPPTAPPPPTDQVVRAARVVVEHCWARLGGTAGGPPASRGSELAALVAQSGRLLREVNRWDR